MELANVRRNYATETKELREETMRLREDVRRHHAYADKMAEVLERTLNAREEEKKARSEENSVALAEKDREIERCGTEIDRLRTQLCSVYASRFIARRKKKIGAISAADKFNIVVPVRVPEKESECVAAAVKNEDVPIVEKIFEKGSYFVSKEKDS